MHRNWSSDMPSYSRPVALVTGASSGIGEAVALALAGSGYAVALVARRAELLERLGARIRAEGGVALPLPTDLRNDDQIEAMARAVEAQLGPVAVLVNNAGVSQRHRAWRPPEDVIENIIGTNLLGPVRVTRAIAPRMVERRQGHIITIGSVAAHVATPGSALYSASKAGLRLWSKALDRELRGLGVRVSLISPGYIRTPMTMNIRFPMAPPAAVARATLGVLARPRRELIVPRYYALGVWLEWFAPWLVDLASKPLMRRLP
jgi:short-subunit dehydrogenase